MVMFVALVLLGLTVFLILQPIIMGREAPLQSGEEEPSEAQFRKRVSLLQLRDVEYEFAMGKLGEEDYQDLRKEISSEALTAIREEESEGKEHLGSIQETGNADLEAEIAAVRARLTGGVFCSECGYPNPAGSSFCAECGVQIQTAQTSGTS